ERLHKRRVSGIVQLWPPAIGEGNALGVRCADRLDKWRADIRPSCEHDSLGIVVLLREDFDEGLGVLDVRPSDEHFGILVDDCVGDWCVVGRLTGEYLIVYRLYSSRFEYWLHFVYLRLREWVILSGIGGGLRALVCWHCGQHLAIAHQQVFNRDRDVVDALDAAIENGRGAASAFE